MISMLALAISFAVLAVATPAPGGSSECNTGPVQCCNSVGEASDASIAKELELLGINVQSVSGLVGVTCSPITIIGASGTSCSSQTVCCQNNNFNGIVALGCTPINISL